jgi:hypothetical protein
MRELLVATVLGACFGSCSGVPADEGTDADLQVRGAQFVRGPLPDDQGGPVALSVHLETNDIHPGEVDKPCSGALDHDATAVSLALFGDKGYWLLRAGAPDVQTPSYPSFKAWLSFSASLAPGAHDLVVRGSDANDRFGPLLVQRLSASDAQTPSGHLVVSLAWDTEADLDLRVVDPSGAEIWKRNINSYQPPPGEPIDPAGYAAAGVLDLDSNAQCVIDGRRRENVVYKTVAPSGHYAVRVDTFSLCAEAVAHWKVEARVDGRSLGASRGTSLQIDADMPHDRGAGILALEIEVP